MHGRRAARTSKCSAVCYVERETAFWAIDYLFQTHTHPLLSSIRQQASEILKTFLEMPCRFDGEISATLKTIKYLDSMHIKNDSGRTI
jgi:hypothetical protein